MSLKINGFINMRHSGVHKKNPLAGIGRLLEPASGYPSVTS